MFWKKLSPVSSLRFMPAMKPPRVEVSVFMFAVIQAMAPDSATKRSPASRLTSTAL